MLFRSQEAWTLFRIGELEDFSERKAFRGSQFPVSKFDDFARVFVPRWLSTSRLHVNTLVALLKKVGPAIVICHSQGGEISVDAMAEVPELFAALIAIEPSSKLEKTETRINGPTTIVAGDFLDQAFWQTRYKGWCDWVSSISENGDVATLLQPDHGLQRGNSHMLMMDKNSADVLDVCLESVFLTT